jgi:hypothetical protein
MFERICKVFVTIGTWYECPWMARRPIPAIPDHTPSASEQGPQDFSGYLKLLRINVAMPSEVPCKEIDRDS